MARTVTDKTMHLGRAGQFAAMAEILARGWNVAIPEVDLGDDVFVAQDDGARLTRVQLKTTIAEPGPGGKWRANSITLPRRQLLRDNEPVPLTYVFAVRTEHQWQFVIVSREDLRALWDDFQAERPSTTAQGGDVVGIRLVLSEDDVAAWGGRSFQRFRNNWDRFELLMQPARLAPTVDDRSPSLAPLPASPTHEDDRR